MSTRLRDWQRRKQEKEASTSSSGFGGGQNQTQIPPYEVGEASLIWHAQFPTTMTELSDDVFTDGTDKKEPDRDHEPKKQKKEAKKTSVAQNGNGGGQAMDTTQPEDNDDDKAKAGHSRSRLIPKLQLKDIRPTLRRAFEGCVEYLHKTPGATSQVLGYRCLSEKDFAQLILLAERDFKLEANLIHSKNTEVGHYLVMYKKYPDH